MTATLAACGPQRAISPRCRCISTTPVGKHGVLGDLWRPKYIVGGMAIHGYPHVPAFPASHGCIRVSNAAMDHLWATRLLPLGSSVWVY